MRYDLVDLKLFLSTVEAQSITGGAERSHLSVASASARIKGMEDALGTPLLERNRRGITPTPAGRALAHHAQVVMHQLALMNSELGGYASGLRSRVRLVCNTAALTEHLPYLLSTFLVKNPSIDLDVEERPSRQIVEALTRHQVEIGIAADSTDLTGLDRHPFRADPLVAITTQPLSPFAGKASLRFEDLLDQTFVGLATTSALQQHLEKKAIQSGKWLNLRVRVSDLDAVCALVSHGVGVAVVPEATYQRSPLKANLAMYRLEDAWAIRDLYVCAHSFSALSSPATTLVDHILGHNSPSV